MRTGWIGIFAVVLLAAGCHRDAPPAANQAPASSAAAPVNAAPSPAASADADDAKAFLVAVYDHYKTNKNNHFQMYDANVADVFDPAMLALLAEDRKQLKGELGTIDGDALCACQDFVSLKATVTVQSATPTTATATSDFTDLGMAGDGPRHDAFQLVKVNGAWRIHDLKAGDEQWLRKQLIDEINTLKSGGGSNRADDDAA